MGDLKPIAAKFKWESWVRGTAVHSALAMKFESMQKSGRHPWLTIIDPSLQFTLGVGGISVRIYTGDAEEPSRSAQKISPAEKASIDCVNKELEEHNLELVRKGKGNLELFSNAEVESRRPPRDNIPEELWAWRIAVLTELDGTAYSTTMVQVAPNGDNRYHYPIDLRDAPTLISTVEPNLPEGVPLSSPLVGAVPPPREETGSEGAQGDLEDGLGSPHDNDDDDR
ncbi:MAG: hypothetical protein ACJ8AT_27290 [Hyalangium sp.]|uniref:hypothetical protein n=1 Tax=Hyalangium sp. TaxID=2028555 RepID=UPI00389B0AD5